MTLTLAATIEADASNAERALKKAQDALNKTKDATAGLSKSATTATASTDKLGTEASQTAAQLSQAAAQAEGMASKSRSLGTANNALAGQTGNLVSQFNDIGVTLAMGQSPMTIALQQGTQISQVLGPLGAAGAVKALGSAFIGMLNPISLATIGGIAFGTAVAQWAVSALGEVKNLEDAFEDLESGVDAYVAAAKAANAQTEDLEKQFGSTASAAQAVLKNMQARELVQALTAANDVAAALSRQFQNYEMRGSNAWANSEYKKLSALLNMPTTSLIDPTTASANKNVLSDIRELFSEISTASGIDNQIEKVADLRKAFIAAAESVDGISEAENEVIDNLDTMYLGLLTIKGTQEDTVTAMRQKLETLQSENALRSLIQANGENSLQVAQMMQKAERAVFEEMLASSSASEDLKNQLRDAFDKAQSLAMVDMVPGIASAADEAARLRKELHSAMSASSRLAAGASSSLQKAMISREYHDDPVQKAGALAALDYDTKVGPLTALPDGAAAYAGRERQQLIEQAMLTAGLNEEVKELNNARKAGDKSSQDAQRRVQRLLTQKRLELDILRESDPVQKLLIKNRDTLASATAQQREELENLIRTTEDEKQTLEDNEKLWQSLGNTAYDALDRILIQGGNVNDVIDDLGKTLARAALQALVLGTGPLAGILGTGITGESGNPVGLVGGVISGEIPLFADGGALEDVRNSQAGLITGPGSGRSDSILIRASAEEFIVNAAATRKNRNLLEAINGGADITPAFKDGGMLGFGFYAGAFGKSLSNAQNGHPSAQDSNMKILVELSPELEGRIIEKSGTNSLKISKIASNRAVFDYDKNLPTRMREVNNFPRGR